jgi:predicted aspartyl protease
MSPEALEPVTMGRVTTAATIENLEDRWEVKRGLRAPGEARRIDVADALVDTGTTAVSLPTRLIKQLGLEQVGTRQTLTAAGPRTANRYEAARLTIQGRDCLVDVLEVPDDVPVLIGQVPLELLDFVVDSSSGKLIGNPAHGGQQMIEMY